MDSNYSYFQVPPKVHHTWLSPQINDWDGWVPAGDFLNRIALASEHIPGVVEGPVTLLMKAGLEAGRLGWDGELQYGTVHFDPEGTILAWNVGGGMTIIASFFGRLKWDDAKEIKSGKGKEVLNVLKGKQGFRSVNFM